MQPLLYITLLLVCLGLVQGQQTRTLSYEVNPGCKDDCKKTTLVHISSSNANGTYHYLWCFVDSFTPAIFMFETDNQAKLNVKWPNLTENDAISFTGTVRNSFAMELSSVYFLNATNNASLYTVPLDKISWTYKDSSSSGAVLFTFSSTKESPINGSVSLDLGVYDQAGRSDSIPRLQYTESSTLFEVTLDKIYFKIADNKTAQAQPVCDLTFVIEGYDIFTNLHESVSIDDEYTPGVFQRYAYSLLAKKTAKGASNDSAYAEWKPVAYYDPAKVIAKSIKVTSPTAQKDSLKRHTILNAYFGNKKFQANALKNFKFGIPDDDFDYQKNSFLQFSLSTGLNQVPEETLSLTLKIIIVAGLGLPMILFLISIVYTIFRKLRYTNDFATLNEDTS